MSEQLATKEQVSLDDLKRAIEIVHAKDPGEHAVVPPGKPSPWWVDKCHEYNFARMEAWRTAFEWLDQFPDSWWTQDQDEEYAEGIALIREKLR